MHIQLKAISRSFQRKKALDDLTLRFSDNECYALVGRNGAGKTTLLKTIAGLLRPDKGGISIDDQPYPAYPPAIRRRIDVLFGEETLLDELNALEYLQFVSLCYGVGKTKDEISRLFAFFFGDTNALNQRIRTYSTGMKQKIALCAAVIHQPDILLLDEPFAGIDPFSAGRYIDFINTYKKHRIVIVSSHDLEYIARVADRVGVIDAGRLITEASTADFTGNGEKDLATALFSIIAPDQAERHLLQDLFEKKTP